MVYSTHHVSEIWCTQKPEGVPDRYDYYVKNLLNSQECIISIVHSGRLIYFLLTYNNWYKVNSLISAFHKHIMTQSLFHISVIMCFNSVQEKKTL